MPRVYIGIFFIAAYLLGGCAGMNFEPVDKAPSTDYEKAILQQQKALEDQQRTMLNAYNT